MQDKRSFSKYITEKRKEKGLTQEELAEKLYVIPTTISKWERGVSYPDITMISNLCKELNISEHEFFTACDDEAWRKIKKENNNYRFIKKMIYYFLTFGYIISLIVCFACDLLINRTISWSLIVLVGIAISFTLTHLSIYYRKHQYRWIILTAIISCLIYLLLFSINLVINGNWLFDSYVIATIALFFVWVDVLICNLTSINTKYKIALSLIDVAVVTLISNPLLDNVLKLSNNQSNVPNIICAILMIGIAIVISCSNKK